ncbi:TPA: Mrp/NBP35 family ATP-binding protein [Candidatus Bathyarchaeota archaeon]|nr:Mrp/NBP35 family ATP-binding protein [Candidatus Bathyarchaeota archaeon]
MTSTTKQVIVAEECDGKCGSCSTLDVCNDRRKQQYEQEQKLRLKLSKIKHKIAIISGKGGVGKSTVTANLAVAFAMAGHKNKVGVLDADIHGPCIPKMLGLKGQTLIGGPAGMLFPVISKLGLRVVSMDFLLPNDEAPVIWRGPLKMRAIQQFLSDITWGDLDYLFIDLPPGTGDESLSVMQLIPEMDGVVIVTIPSDVSQAIVRKAVTFARQMGVPVIGIVENMSGFVCPDCGAKVNIFRVGGGKKIAEDLSVPYLGSIPIDPNICIDSDNGVPFVAGKTTSPTTEAFAEIVRKIEHFTEEPKSVSLKAHIIKKSAD